MANETTLIIGPPGSGKSNFAATWPKPMLFLDLDCKGESTVMQARQEGISFWTFPEPIFISAMEIRIRPKKKGKDEGEAPAPMLPEKNEPQAWKKFTGKVNELWSTTHGYKTVVLDTWTFLCLAAARQLQFLNKQMGMPLTLPDYGVLLEKFKEVVPILLGIPCEHFVMLAHEEYKEAEEGSQIGLVPWSVGNKIAFILPAFFQNYYQCYTSTLPGKDKYMVRTGSFGLFSGRCTYAAPDILPQDWASFPTEKK